MFGRVSLLARDQRGAAIVEFAFVLPVLVVLLFGLLTYGQYFLLAHSAQQLANDAARATVAGLDSAERLTIAQGVVAREKAALPEVASTSVSASVSEAADLVTVSVRVDASRLALFRARIFPLPEAQIERRAVVRAGGIV